MKPLTLGRKKKSYKYKNSREATVIAKNQYPLGW